MSRNALRALFAVVALAVFAAVWVWLVIRLVTFTPTDAVPVLELTPAQVTMASFLASSVATVTATPSWGSRS